MQTPFNGRLNGRFGKIERTAEIASMVISGVMLTLRIIDLVRGKRKEAVHEAEQQ